MSDDLHIPILQEEAHIAKRSVDTERVNVRTFAEEREVVVRDEVSRQQVEVTRIPVDREVAEAPLVRTEGDLTIVPVLEERLVVEKRLFLVEELHLRRITTTTQMEVPTSVRRTRVDVDREILQPQEDH